MVALAVLISAGAGAAAMSRGGVTESRGVTSAPTREFRTPRRRPQPVRVAQPRTDSVAASVGDSVALLLGQPPVQQHPPRESPEVNVPARGRRGDPLDQQIKQMLPDPQSGARQAEPEPPSLPAMNLNTIGNAAEATIAYARARIDSATRKDVKPTFKAPASSAARP